LIVQRSQENVKKKEDEVKEGKRVASTLQGDMHTLRLELADLKKVVQQLERERTNLQQEISAGRLDNQQLVDEIRMRDIKVRCSS